MNYWKSRIVVVSVYCLGFLALGPRGDHAHAEGHRVAELELLWSVGGEDEPIGVVADLVQAADGSVLMLDIQSSEVRMYSKDGEFVRLIGRTGEGPGELRRPYRMAMLGGSRVAVLQRIPPKIVVLGLDGEIFENYPLPHVGEGAFRNYLMTPRSIGDGALALMAIGRQREATESHLIDTILGVSPDGGHLATYYESKRTVKRGDHYYHEGTHEGPVWEASPEGRIFVNEEFDEYRINVFSADGELIHVVGIEEQAPWERTPERYAEREREIGDPAREAEKSGNGYPWSVSAFERSVQALFPRNGGGVWVLTGHGAYERREGVLGVFDSFDGDGYFNGSIDVVGLGNWNTDGYYVFGDRFFVVRNFLGAERGFFGADGSAEDGESETVFPAVLCYRIPTNLGW